MKILNDFVVASDSGKLSFVVLLDLSAAFDMVDHVILFNRLAKNFGIRGTALSWLISFLSDRSICVSVKSCFSYEADIIHGVPQGSVLGPLLFSLFVSPVTDIVQSYGLQCHTYADDVAIYFSCYPRDICSFLDTLRSCLNHVYDWFSSNLSLIHI